MLFGGRPAARRSATARSAVARSVKIPIVGVIVGSPVPLGSLFVQRARVDERVQAFPPTVRGKRHATRSDPMFERKHATIRAGEKATT
jgi:hypothetical protein